MKNMANDGLTLADSITVTDAVDATGSDVTAFVATPPAEFEPKLIAWAASGLTPAHAALIRERAIRLLASGTAAALLDEAMMLLTVAVAERSNHGYISAITELLADAARPAGPFKVDLIRREYGLAFEALIEVLSLNGPMAMSDLRFEIATNDLTRLLAKMHEADLIRFVRGIPADRKIELTDAGYRLA